jgi:hypothetical protein
LKCDSWCQKPTKNAFLRRRQKGTLTKTRCVAGVMLFDPASPQNIKGNANSGYYGIMDILVGLPT